MIQSFLDTSNIVNFYGYNALSHSDWTGSSRVNGVTAVLLQNGESGGCGVIHVMACMNCVCFVKGLIGFKLLFDSQEPETLRKKQWIFLVLNMLVIVDCKNKNSV